VETHVRLCELSEAVDDGALARQLDGVQRVAQVALGELRALARGIHPATLHDLGPVAALRALADRSAVPIQVIEQGVTRCASAIEAAIYFCARETIQNVTKPSAQRPR
jgi:signal transduction histidine kinase